MSAASLHPLGPADREWVGGYIASRWGAETVVVHGAIYRPAELSGLVALREGRPVGLVTCHIEGRRCEIVTLNSDLPGEGIGAALVAAVAGAALAAGCNRLWLITTNDNLPALRFYQKRGFRLVAVHPGAVDRARALKPEIPHLGLDGIPLRDEIELEMELEEGQDGRRGL